ncbi:hypothetical protein O9929_12615 [Vibrio lentus]|nr:hypothetical protein [Vibrio lentus]
MLPIGTASIQGKVSVPILTPFTRLMREMMFLWFQFVNTGKGDKKSTLSAVNSGVISMARIDDAVAAFCV